MALPWWAWGLSAAGLAVSFAGVGLAIAGVDTFGAMLMSVGTITMCAVVIGGQVTKPSD
jgi:hypothetical protein